MYFDSLIRFVSSEDQKSYFAPISCKNAQLQACRPGEVVVGYSSIGDLEGQQNGKKVTIKKLQAPLPSPSIPIYCVGLNYRSHAAEAKLNIPKYPPLWTKPAASLADPDEVIPIAPFCATSLLDYEGELVFVTSKDAKNVSVEDAESYILGYTTGNDLSCRLFQMPDNSGGQFFYAKAFDKFAPIGPILVSAQKYQSSAAGRRLRTRVNGEVVQDVEIAEDMVFTPAQILSHMSQGTTISAGTTVMTGTAAGVGVFRSPKTFLQDGDKVEVEIDGLGILRNVVQFEK